MSSCEAPEVPILGVVGVVQAWPVQPPWMGWGELRTEVGRCSGHCCRAFTLPLSPDLIERMKAALDAEERGEPWPGGLRRPNGIEVVARMVRPYGPFHMLTPAGDRFDSNLHWYACEHHDPGSGDCKIYESRPEMCRHHPYGRGCNYLDCTMREEVERYEWVGPPNVHELVESSHEDSLLEPLAEAVEEVLGVEEGASA